MPRRKDRIFAGRSLAGEDGSLFLTSDGISPLWDWQRHEVYENPMLARGAWQRARRSSWSHELREDVWPPEGARKWDKVTARTEQVALRGSAADVAAAVAVDLASIAAFRAADPDAAASVAPWLAEYETALELLAGIAASAGDDGEDGSPSGRAQAVQAATTRL